MNMELFKPNKGNERLSLVQRLSEMVRTIRGAEKPKIREFFNEDRSRKWVFRPDDSENSQEPEQLNAELLVKIAGSWVCLMHGMMRWDANYERGYVLEISEILGLQKVSLYCYDANTGGKKQINSTQIHIIPEGMSGIDIYAALCEAGVRKENGLPEFIDFESTMSLFMQQAKNLDFSTPRIIEKDLIR